MKKKKKAAARKTATRTRRKKTRAIKAVAADRDWSAEIGTMFRPIKKPVTLRLDADVVAWFKVEGKGYQTRINRALRRVMKEEKKSAG